MRLLIILLIVVVLFTGCSSGNSALEDKVKDVARIDVYYGKGESDKPLMIDGSFTVKELVEQIKKAKSNSRPAEHAKSKYKFYLVFRYKDGSKTDKMYYTFLKPDKKAYVDIDTCYKLPAKFNSLILAAGAQKLMQNPSLKKESSKFLKSNEDKNNKDKKSTAKKDEDKIEEEDLNVQKEEETEKSSNEEHNQYKKFVHEKGYYTLSLPAGWEVQKTEDYVLNNIIVPDSGCSIKLTTFVTGDLIPENHLPSVYDRQFKSSGISYKWAASHENNFYTKYAKYKYNGSNVISALARKGDFTFQITISNFNEGKGEDYLNTILKGFDNLKQMSNDPTGGNTFLLGNWVSTNTTYTDRAGGGTKDTLTFYSDGTLTVSSFIAFSGGSGNDAWSASSGDGKETLAYIVVDDYIYLYSNNAFLVMRLQTNGQALQLGQKVYYKE